jgi:hypothetical protein
MNAIKLQNKQLTGIAWGSLFLFLGILMVIPGDQNSLFLLGAGVIFLALNGLRRYLNYPVNIFSTLMGFLALGAGVYGLVRPVLGLPHYQVDVLPLLLIVIGLYILIPGPKSRPEKGTN